MGGVVTVLGKQDKPSQTGLSSSGGLERLRLISSSHSQAGEDT